MNGYGSHACTSIKYMFSAIHTIMSKSNENTKVQLPAISATLSAAFCPSVSFGLPSLTGSFGSFLFCASGTGPSLILGIVVNNELFFKAY